MPQEQKTCRHTPITQVKPDIYRTEIDGRGGRLECIHVWYHCLGCDTIRGEWFAAEDYVPY